MMEMLCGWKLVICLAACAQEKAYLDTPHGPRLDVPFSKADAFHVIINEHALRADLQDQSISHTILPSNEARLRLGE